MVKIKDTILETTIKYLVISVLAIFGTALTIILKEIGDLFLVKVYPDISKKLLSELLLIALALCLITISYIFFLKKQLSNKLTKIKLTKFEESILLIMANKGDDDYQTSFFIKVLKIEKSRAELYLKHLTDKGFLKCEYDGLFPHYSMNEKGRQYLIDNKLII